MNNLAYELNALLAEDGLEDSDKLEAVRTLAHNNSRRCTPEEDEQVLRDLFISAGIDPDAPKPVEAAAVPPSVDYQRIEEIVVKVVTGGAAAAATDHSRYWTPKRAARECGVSERTFAEWRASGKVRFYKPCRRVLIDPAVLAEDLAKFGRQRMPKYRSRMNK